MEDTEVIDEAGIDTEVIDEARICGDWSDDEDDGVDTSEARVLSVEGHNKPVDAKFLPLDSTCEEHTCPWNFVEGGRDLGLGCPGGPKLPLCRAMS